MIGWVLDFDTVSENCKTPHKLDVSEMPIDLILLNFYILLDF